VLVVEFPEFPVPSPLVEVPEGRLDAIAPVGERRHCPRSRRASELVAGHADDQPPVGVLQCRSQEVPVPVVERAEGAGDRDCPPAHGSPPTTSSILVFRLAGQ